jgi:hypothetical protein
MDLRQFFKSERWKKFFEATGWIVALVALIVGIVHVREIQKTASELRTVQKSLSGDLTTLRKSLSGDLGTVKSSLSTQFAGHFPDFLPVVIATIQSSRHDLNILCDVPAYADYSDPARGMILRQLIEQKLQEGVKVHLICLSKNRRIDAPHSQFNRRTTEKALASREDRKPLLKYLGVPDSDNHNVTYDSFIAAIETNDETAIHSFRGATITEVDTDIPMFFWIADGRSCVMAV